MPKGRTAESLRQLSRGIHEAILAEYGIPERDYFHVLTDHPRGQIFARMQALGFERTTDVVMIQIFTQCGRSQEAKQFLFAAIPASLAEITNSPYAPGAKTLIRPVSPPNAGCSYVSTNF